MPQFKGVSRLPHRADVDIRLGLPEFQAINKANVTFGARKGTAVPIVAHRLPGPARPRNVAFRGVAVRGLLAPRQRKQPGRP
jgi:hypothetical protein